MIIFVRVERLGYDADLCTTDDARRRFVLVLTINSLRNISLEKKLMVKSGLYWDERAKILKARSRTRQTMT